MTAGRSPALRIGIDGRTLEPPRTGVGRYVFEICRGLDVVLPPDTEFYVYARRPVPLPVDSPRWTMRAESVAGFQRLPASAWLKARGGRLAERDSVAVFWGAGALAPGLGWTGPTVLTVHDLCPFIAPETLVWSTRVAASAWLARDVRRAAAVVAASVGTSRRIRALLGVDCAAAVPSTAGAAFHPPDADRVRAVRQRLGLARPYFLSVATREPRKNLPLLVDSYGRARTLDVSGGVAAHDLVLAGGAGWGSVTWPAVPGVRTLGYVADDDLPALYAGATAFVFPSRYEGFGIPVLEARMCGARVITTDLPELHEAGGVEDVTYVAPKLDPLTRALIDAAAIAGMPVAPRREPPGTWVDAARVYATVLTSTANSAADARAISRPRGARGANASR